MQFVRARSFDGHEETVSFREEGKSPFKFQDVMVGDHGTPRTVDKVMVELLVGCSHQMNNVKR